jgi:hypothetical protein
MGLAAVSAGAAVAGAGAQLYGASQAGGGAEYIESPLEKQKREAQARQEEYYTGGLPTIWTYVQPQNNPLAAAAAYNLTQKGSYKEGTKQGGLFMNWKGLGDVVRGDAKLKDTKILNPETTADRRAYLAMAAQAPLPNKVYTPQQIQQQLLNKQAPANNDWNPLYSAALGV